MEQSIASSGASKLQTLSKMGRLQFLRALGRLDLAVSFVPVPIDRLFGTQCPPAMKVDPRFLQTLSAKFAS